MSRTGNFFIVMRIDLKTDPAVVAMAVDLKVRPEVVVGYLHSVWSWFSANTEDGRCFGVSIEALEVATNLNGFPQLMEEYGWLREWKGDDGRPNLMIPNWERWFGGAEERKEYERERKRQQRLRRGASKTVPDNVPDKLGTDGGTNVGHQRDTLRPQTQGQTQGQREEQMRIKTEPHRNTHSADEVGDAFDRFWDVVHHKVGKGHARKAFHRAVKNGTPPEVIIEAMTEFAQTPDASPRDRTPIHPTTWINAERWDDDPEAWQSSDTRRPQIATAEDLRNWRP